MADTFVAICGTPRSGSSLACDLVRACGYNFGDKESLVSSDNPRHARNVHVRYSNMNWVKQPEMIISAMRRQGITALNVVPYFPDMIPELQRYIGKDLKIVVTTRDLKTAILSHIEYAMMVDTDSYSDQPSLSGRCFEAAQAVECRQPLAQKILDSDVYNTFELPFERVVEADVDILSRLAEFLGCETWMQLLYLVNPNISRWK